MGGVFRLFPYPCFQAKTYAAVIHNTHGTIQHKPVFFVFPFYYRKTVAGPDMQLKMVTIYKFFDILKKGRRYYLTRPFQCVNIGYWTSLQKQVLILGNQLLQPWTWNFEKYYYIRPCWWWVHHPVVLQPSNQQHQLKMKVIRADKISLSYLKEAED